MTPRDPAATDAPIRLRSAVFANQREWVRRIGGLDASGLERPIHDAGGVLAVRTGTTGAIMLPDPPNVSAAALTGAIDWLRHSGSADVLIWSVGPEREVDRYLSACGARDNFAPRWMTRPAQRALPATPNPAGIAIRLAVPGDLSMLLAATDLPYHSPWQVRSTLHLATTPGTSDNVALAVAIARDAVVGRAVMSLSGSTGIRTAGVYDVGVTPDWQRQGVGRLMMRALLEIARDRGADLVTLNATPAGERLYRSLGFEDAGDGQTWLLPSDTLRLPPDEDRVRFAMCISGGDDLSPMRHLAGQLLPNGDTPLAHAARFEQVDAARQLIELGTVPDIAALWELGLEDEAIAAMANRKALDARRGRQRATPLHIAIYWDDLELLEALLDAGANPRVRDGEFDSDAWGWCHALGRVEALRILNRRFSHR